ncbi:MULTISPECIES: hypothetical protein [Clostridium]|uniref:hypothetical protein n=1 Tax=Clostridium TaxID=1485 RepID=UPI00069CCCEA|nr:MULTISPECIES: hypothetical protein [Clostridium]KOF58189.1 hypothetical protein AGR56_00635 [Clostridium sp. DMHC 10]MCD2345562.1 hypothetical protein [Clostridium guangxiense]
MKSTLFDENGHLSVVTIEKLKIGNLSDDDMLLVSEHICDCEKCADCFANSFDDNELVNVPLGFEEEVQSKIEKNKQVRRDFMFYSFKVGIAVCVAIVITFSNIFNIVSNEHMKKYVNTPNLNIVSSINTKLTDFSQKIINMEVFKHAK